MTEVEFQRVLKEALEERYADIPDPDELEYEYTFSPRFERRMKRMIRNFDRIRSKAQREAAHTEVAQQNRRKIGRLDSERSMQYVTLGRHTMRRAVAIALAATLILALAACAIRFAIIWHETTNEKQGTLDVTFELEDRWGQQKPLRSKNRPCRRDMCVQLHFRRMTYRRLSMQILKTEKLSIMVNHLFLKI